MLRQQFAPQNWRLWSFENFGDAEEKDVCWDDPLCSSSKEAGMILLKGEFADPELNLVMG